MLFNLVDVILIVMVAGFGLAGLMMGLIETVGALAGLVLGVWVAGQFYGQVASWLLPVFGGNIFWSKIVAFLVIFAIVSRLVLLLFKILSKIFKIISLIPFISSINRLAGLALGLVEGILFSGLILYVVAKFGIQIPWLVTTIDASRVAHVLVGLVGFLTALLPEALTKIQSIF